MRVAALAYVLSACLANTEVLTFEVPSYSTTLSSEVAGLPVLSRGSIKGNLTSYDIPQHFAINTSAGKYLCRVCWPASQPGNFSLGYENGIVTVTASRGDVYELAPSQSWVEFELHLSRQLGGVIPEDMMSTIFKISALAIGSLGACYMLL